MSLGVALRRLLPGRARRLAHRPLTATSQAREPLGFRCNICKRRNRIPWSELHRESTSCARCGSTVRMRAMVHILTLGLFGESLPIWEVPRRRDLRGVGLSDWKGYARPLAKRLGYTNTYFHQEPRLDITEVPPEAENRLDFLIASDVFEHVAPPVHRAFEGARRLLAPGGLLVLSVPYSTAPETVEHFPDLHQFTIRTVDGRPVLENVTRTGEAQRFDSLAFHGGDGETLEMRLFCESDLLAHLEAAGFQDIRIHGRDELRWGIHWAFPWSLPISARAPAQGAARAAAPR